MDFWVNTIRKYRQNKADYRNSKFTLDKKLCDSETVFLKTFRLMRLYRAVKNKSPTKIDSHIICTLISFGKIYEQLYFDTMVAFINLNNSCAMCFSFFNFRMTEKSRLYQDCFLKSGLISIMTTYSSSCDFITEKKDTKFLSQLWKKKYTVFYK